MPIFEPAEAQQASCDRLRRPILANLTVSSGMVWSKPGKPKRIRKSGEIVPIRAGPRTASRRPGTMLLPARQLG